VVPAFTIIRVHSSNLPGIGSSNTGGWRGADTEQHNGAVSEGNHGVETCWGWHWGWLSGVRAQAVCCSMYSMCQKTCTHHSLSTIQQSIFAHLAPVECCLFEQWLCCAPLPLSLLFLPLLPPSPHTQCTNTDNRMPLSLPPRTAHYPAAAPPCGRQRQSRHARVQ
jgi:hypothetical protein